MADLSIVDTACQAYIPECSGREVQAANGMPFIRPARFFELHLPAVSASTSLEMR
jgi:hypothetical protein